MPEFAAAFSCKADSKLVKKPHDTVAPARGLPAQTSGPDLNVKFIDVRDFIRNSVPDRWTERLF